MALRHHSQWDLVLLHRPDQAYAPLDLAVVEHDARCRDLHGGSSRALVDQQGSTTIREVMKSVIQTHRMIALALGDREQPGLSASARMGVNCPPVGDDKAFGAERFQPDVVGARGD